jgi:hypothetical protein
VHATPLLGVCERAGVGCEQGAGAAAPARSTSMPYTAGDIGAAKSQVGHFVSRWEPVRAAVTTSVMARTDSAAPSGSSSRAGIDGVHDALGQPLGVVSGRAGLGAAVDLGLANPVLQRLGKHPSWSATA